MRKEKLKMKQRRKRSKKTVFRVTGVMKVKGQRFWDKHQPLS